MSHIQETTTGLWRPESTHEKIDSTKMFINNIMILELLFNDIIAGNITSGNAAKLGGSDANTFLRNTATKRSITENPIDYPSGLWYVEGTVENGTSKPTNINNGHPSESMMIMYLVLGKPNIIGQDKAIIAIDGNNIYNRYYTPQSIGSWSRIINSADFEYIGISEGGIGIEWKSILKNANMGVTFFSNWDDTEGEFPEIYGTGVVLPGKDARDKNIIYTTGSNLWIGDMVFTDNWMYTIKWRNLTNTVGGYTIMNETDLATAIADCKTIDELVNQMPEKSILYGYTWNVPSWFPANMEAGNWLITIRKHSNAAIKFELDNVATANMHYKAGYSYGNTFTGWDHISIDANTNAVLNATVITE